MRSRAHRLIFASLCASLLALAGATLPAAAQNGTNEWIWMSGSSTLPAADYIPATYGTQGTPAAANTPGSRSQAAAWTDSSGRLWLFGGFNFDSLPQLFYLNDLWEFDPSTSQWTWMGGSNMPTSNCPTIEGNIICGQPGQYGTKGSSAAGNWPGGRYSDVTWVDGGGRFWMYGGWGIDAENQVGILGDLWMFDPSTGQWTWVGGDSTLPATGENNQGVYGMLGVPAAGNYPGSLTFSSEATDPNGNTWVFGGWGFNDNNQNSLPNKLWEYQQSTGDWGWMAGPIVTNPDFDPAVYGAQGVAAAGNTPSSRWDVFTWSSADGNIWAFGGDGYDDNGDSGLFNQLWEFEPSAGQWAWIGGPQLLTCAAGSDNQNCGNPGSYGTLGVAAESNLPGGRSRGASWTDKAGNLWLFGGVGFDANGLIDQLNDLWKYNPSTREWTWVGGPSTGDSGTAVYGALGIAGPANLPGRRNGVTRWTDKDGNFWIYGGNGFDAANTIGILDDLWEYQPSTATEAGTFTVSANPASVTVTAGASGTSTITTTVSGGFDSPVALSATGQPSSVTVSFQPSSIAGSGTSTMTMNVGAGTAPGGYGITVTGTGGSLSETALITLLVNAPGPAATPTFSPAPGTYATTQTVTLSDATPGATIYYTTDGSVPTATSTVYAGGIPVAATETIQALATAPGFTASPVASATYTITPSFTISLNPTAITVAAGQSGTTTITETTTGGFNGNVVYSCSGLPPGDSCGFAIDVIPTITNQTYTTLTLLTAAQTGKLQRSGGPWLPAASLAAIFCCLGWKRRRLQMVLLLMLSAAGLSVLSGCVVYYTPHGGGGGPVPVIVTGTSGTMQSSATLTLTVN